MLLERAAASKMRRSMMLLRSDVDRGKYSSARHQTNNSLAQCITAYMMHASQLGRRRKDSAEKYQVVFKQRHQVLTLSSVFPQAFTIGLDGRICITFATRAGLRGRICTVYATKAANLVHPLTLR